MADHHRPRNPEDFQNKGSGRADGDEIETTRQRKRTSVEDTLHRAPEGILRPAAGRIFFVALKSIMI